MSLIEVQIGLQGIFEDRVDLISEATKLHKPHWNSDLIAYRAACVPLCAQTFGEILSTRQLYKALEQYLMRHDSILT